MELSNKYKIVTSIIFLSLSVLYYFLIINLDITYLEILKTTIYILIAILGVWDVFLFYFNWKTKRFKLTSVNILISICLLSLSQIVIDNELKNLEPINSGSAFLTLELEPAMLIDEKKFQGYWNGIISIVDGKQSFYFMVSTIPYESWGSGDSIDIVNVRFNLHEQSKYIGEPIIFFNNAELISINLLLLKPGTKIRKGKCIFTFNGDKSEEIVISPQEVTDFSLIYLKPPKY